MKCFTVISFWIAATGAFPHGDGKHRPNALSWAPCDLDFGLPPGTPQSPADCAKLNVPLDYTNSGSEQLQLQLLRVNATKKPFKGSVLFNPGGPGGSGVELVALGAPIFDSVLGGHYDLIGFDPRGTGRTIPFDCRLWNETSKVRRRDLLVQRDLQDLLVSEGWENSGEIANACIGSNYGSFLSTAFVARDMARIVDALDEDGKLRFWGTSYGTLLGSTFAAMFPEKVDRMLLDSVINPHDYMAGYWLTALLNTDKALLGFFEECLRKPSLCPLSQLAGPRTTANDLVQALDKVLQDLLKNPIYLPAGGLTSVLYKEPPITFYEDIKRGIFDALYVPSRFPILAANLQLVLSRKFTEYQNNKPKNITGSTWNKGRLAFFGIACSDGEFRASRPEDMFSLVAAQQNISTFGDVFFGQIWPCAQWKLQAAERYSGDFKAKTNFPILFTNGQFDPITPLPSAINASAGFEGSVVLQHSGHGHTFLRQPSLCMGKAIRAYFVDGTLPAPGTICETDVSSFEIATDSALNISLANSGAETQDERELLETLVFASKVFG